jgi:heme-degrading monooxygenase HmoA
MFIRIWRYRVPADQDERFEAVYGSSGPWADLFARGRGYLGTELYQDVRQRVIGGTRWITVDHWAEERDWARFLADWRADYDALDHRLEGVAADETELFAGTVDD